MPKQTIGEFLATQRKAKGYTQQYVADILGVSNRTLSAWETNKAYPDILTLPALAELYGVTADEILSGERKNAELKTEEISEKAQSDLYKNRLAQYSSKNTALIAVGVCGAVAVMFGFIFLFVILWLGVALLVLGTLASIVAIILLAAYSKNALTSAGIFVFDKNLSVAKKSFILNVSVTRARILNIFGLVWLGCSIIFTIVLLLWLNNSFIGIFILMPIIIITAAMLIAAVTDRNSAIRKYGTEENITVLKHNSKLLLKCLGFSFIPTAAVIAAFAIMAAVQANSWLVLYEGGEKDFRQYMHTLNKFSCNVVFPEYITDYNELIPDTVLLEIPEEIKSGEYIPVYGDLIYVYEDDTGLGIYLGLKNSDEENEEPSEKYYWLYSAVRLDVNDSDILVYNIRFSDGVNYGEIKAEYKDGVYTVLGKNDDVLVLSSLILFIVLAVTGPVVGTTVYLSKRAKQQITLEV